jgi:hypothetical protein
MAARRQPEEAPREHVRLQRSWWFWGVEYTLAGNNLWRADIPAVRGATGEDKKPGDAAVKALTKACEIIATRHPRLHPIDREVVVRHRLPQTRRGCCGRCDLCGALFAPPGAPGCQPGTPEGWPSRCASPKEAKGRKKTAKRRSRCAGCERPYEPMPKPHQTPEGQYDFTSLPEDDDPDFAEPVFPAQPGDRKWTEAPRATSIANKPLVRKERRLHLKLLPWYGLAPKKRSDCAGVQRPCVFVTCRYNLYLDENPETGSIRLNFPHLDPTQMVDSCAMDIAERGGIPLEDLGVMLNVTLEGASQVVDKALAEARFKVDEDRLWDELGETIDRLHGEEE